jgi:hypothetical protein
LGAYRYFFTVSRNSCESSADQVRSFQLRFFVKLDSHSCIPNQVLTPYYFLYLFSDYTFTESSLTTVLAGDVSLRNVADDGAVR